MEFFKIFQMFIYPLGLPTSALQVKLMDWFSSSSFGCTKISSGSLAFAENVRNFEIILEYRFYSFSLSHYKIYRYRIAINFSCK